MVTDGRQISDEELSALVSDPSAPASSDSGSEQSFLDGAEHIRPHNLVTEDTTIGINLAAIDMINERLRVMSVWGSSKYCGLARESHRNVSEQLPLVNMFKRLRLPCQ